MTDLDLKARRIFNHSKWISFNFDKRYELVDFSSSLSWEYVYKCSNEQKLTWFQLKHRKIDCHNNIKNRRNPTVRSGNGTINTSYVFYLQLFRFFVFCHAQERLSKRVFPATVIYILLLLLLLRVWSDCIKRLLLSRRYIFKYPFTRRRGTTRQCTFATMCTTQTGWIFIAAVRLII